MVYDRKNHNTRNLLKADDSRRHKFLRRDREDYQSHREASPRQRDDLDETTRYRDRKEPGRHHGGQEDQTAGRALYGRKETQRDDRAYAAGKSSTRMQRNLPALPSVNELKAKIRDTERLLCYAESLPADTRIEKERALVGYQRDLEIVEARRRRAAMIKKYHFVRFLERKAATRELNKLLRQEHELNESSSPIKQSELEDLQSKIQTARVNLNYTIYSPLTEKYISLYPNNRRDQPPEPEDSNLIRNSSGEKPPLWYAVERSMKENTLELLRDGKLGVGLSGEEVQHGGKNCDLPSSTSRVMKLPVLSAGQKTQQQKRQKNHSSGPDHDMDMSVQMRRDDIGGFFEE